MTHILPCRWIAAQSVFYHLYNQVSYMSLDEISPLTFSIGNTMKRISVIVSSIIIFHTPVQPVNALGAAIAVLGTFLYSQVIFPLLLMNLAWHFIIDLFHPWDLQKDMHALETILYATFWNFICMHFSPINCLNVNDAKWKAENAFGGNKMYRLSRAHERVFMLHPKRKKLPPL